MQEKDDNGLEDSDSSAFSEVYVKHKKRFTANATNGTKSKFARKDFPESDCISASSHEEDFEPVTSSARVKKVTQPSFTKSQVRTSGAWVRILAGSIRFFV